MNRVSRPSQSGNSSRREFLQGSGALAAGSALAAVSIPAVHAAESNTIGLALIGCGGRGSGAAVNAFESTGGPVKMVAMADLYDKRLQAAHSSLSKRFADKMDVPADRQFIGFDAYKKAIDCLKPGDVAMLTNFAGFRPQQLEYAVKKGINVFMEKSFAPDVPGLRRIIAAGEEAKKKNLKIAGGLQCRHSRNRQEVIQRIRDGQMGDIQLIRAYRMQGIGPLRPKPEGESELMFQIRNFTKFLWVSGGLFAEMNIHQIDEICWIKGELPVTAHAVGGRTANSPDISQNLDSLSIEYTFADGTKATDVVRWIPKCYDDFATYIHGTKCAAYFSGKSHASDSRIYKSQVIHGHNVAWRADPEECSPWHAEWNVLLDAIRKNKPHNEAERCAMSNVVDLMGRSAAHTGQMVTFEQAMNSTFQFFPGIDTLTPESAPPILPDKNGYYPIPVPGVWKEL